MANKYWVGGAGTWDVSTTTKWSDSDGGAGGAVAPTSTDDVIFNANSGFGSGGTVTVAATAVCNNFTISGLASKTVIFSFTGNPTFSGAMSWQGNTEAQPILFQSSVVGTARTVTLNGSHGTHSYIHFQDITRAGTAGALTGTRIGDCGGNTGITFDASVARTCTMSTNQNWSAASIWTGTLIPLPQDDVSMAGVTGGTLIADQPRLCRSVSWTGATGTPTWSFDSISNSISGSVTLISGMTVSGAQGLTLAGRGTYTITSAGKAFVQNITLANPGGSYTLNDALTCANFIQNYGGFVSNSFAITCNIFWSANNNSQSMNLGTSTIALLSTSTINVVAFTSSGTFTFIGTPTFVISTTSTSTRTYVGGDRTVGTLTYTVAGSTGKLTITGSNSFSAINFSDANNARTLEFTSGITTTIRSANGFNVVGTAGKLMTVTSSAAGIHTLTSPNQQAFDYVNVSKTTVNATPKWYAGSHSTDGGTNTNIIFTDVPATSIGAGLSITSGDYEVYERAEYQQNLNSSLSSLNDLRRLYFSSKGYTYLSVNDNVRAFLVEQTGLSASHSINDLWRAYAVKQGVTNQVSLSDMLKTLFNSIGLP